MKSFNSFLFLKRFPLNKDKTIVTILHRIFIVWNEDPDNFILRQLRESCFFYLYIQYMFKIYVLDIAKFYTTSTFFYYFHIGKVRKFFVYLFYI